eukprot:2106776-Rhodomonas_salina.1
MDQESIQHKHTERGRRDVGEEDAQTPAHRPGRVGDEDEQLLSQTRTVKWGPRRGAEQQSQGPWLQQADVEYQSPPQQQADAEQPSPRLQPEQL